MKGSPAEMAVWTLMSVSGILWFVFVVTDFTVFSLFQSTEVKTVVATLLGGLSVYDLAATFGLAEYP